MRYSLGAKTLVDWRARDGNSAEETIAPTAAPTSCAITNAGTWFIAIPAKVVVKPRASVTAVLANDVEAVNQYAAVITRPTSHGIAVGAYRRPPSIVST